MKTYLRYKSFPRTQLWAALTTGAVLVMEAILAALWYQAIFEPTLAPFSAIFAILFLILAGSHLLLLLVNRLRLKMIARQAVFLAWTVSALLAGLKLLIYPHTSGGDILALPLRYIIRGDAGGRDFFHLVAVLLLVWRGTALARQPLTLNQVQGSFHVGLVFMLLYGMFYAPLYPVEAVVGLYCFLFFGLFAMSLARIANLSELRGGRVPRFGPGWMLSVTLAALAVVGLAILFGWLSSGRVVEVLVYILVAIIAILTALIVIILSPLLIALSRLLPMLADFLEQLLARFRSLPVGEQMVAVIEALNEALERAVPYIIAARGVVLAAVLAALAAVVLLSLYLRAAFGRSREEDETEFAGPGRVDYFFRKLLRRFQAAGRGALRRRPAQILAAARIRRIYRQLMILCEKMGAARPPSSTPLEFLPRLQLLFPGQQDGLETITGAYMRVRYGKLPETSAEVEAVESAWRSLRKQGRITIAQKRRARKSS